jgi:transcriptional regulator of met regulon
MKNHDEGTSLDANRGYGEKGQFRKISVTLPPKAYERLIQESARRKIAGEPNQLLSALLREAVTEYLSRMEPKSP